MSIAENIKEYRKSKKMTQKELGGKIGKSEISVRKYESGDINPPLDVLNSISTALGVTISELIDSELEGLEGREVSINIGNKIKRFRENMAISQRELARRIGMTGQMISKIELNETMLSVKTLIKIAIVLGVPAYELLDNEAPKIKTLKDFTTDELLKEILKRVNMKVEEI